MTPAQYALIQERTVKRLRKALGLSPVRKRPKKAP